MLKRLSICLLVLAAGLVSSYFLLDFFEAGGDQRQTLSQLSDVAEERLFDARLKSWERVEDFDQPLAVFNTVFWDPRDTISLRQLIRESDLAEDKQALEIGTGSGLLALCCLNAGAKSVVVTDVNRAAIANVRFNASQLKFENRLDARLVPLDDSSAFAVIKPDEKFDLIISNPPWVNRQPQSIDEYALYDENFALMTSLFDGLTERLKPGGRVLLAYGCVDAIKTMQRFSEERGFECLIRDTRSLDDLPEEFLPGMLIEIKIDSITSGDSDDASRQSGDDSIETVQECE